MSSVTSIAGPCTDPTKPRLRWLNRVASGDCLIILRQRHGEAVWLPMGLSADMDRWLTQPSIRPMWQAKGAHPMVLVEKRYTMELTDAGEALRAAFAATYAYGYSVSRETKGRHFRKLPNDYVEYSDAGVRTWRLDLSGLHAREARALAPRCTSCSPRRCPVSGGGCRAPSLAKRGGTT